MTFASMKKCRTSLPESGLPRSVRDHRSSRSRIGLRPMSGFDNAKVDEEFFGAGVDREGMCENMWREQH